MAEKIKIDDISVFFICTLLFSTLLMNNGYYVFFPLLGLLILLYLIQQPFKPAIFSLLCIQHYLQIASAVWLCNYLDKEINYNTPFRSTATIASLIGLFSLMLPVLYFQNKIPKQSFVSLRASVNEFSSQKLLYAYIIAFVASSFLGSIAFVFGGLTQIIISVVKVKWMLFLLFGYHCILNNENKKLFFLFVALEFISGFLGFFSDFKTVIFFLAVLFISLVGKINSKQVIYAFFIGTALLFFGLFWTVIKGDYRTFLNGGQQSQAVVVETNEAVNKLWDLSSSVNSNSLSASTVDFLDRLQYTYHFAKTMEMIPDILPYENGNNWLASIEFTTTPRILNPNKPNYDATEKTKKYTGIKYAGKKEGVSFSLGYFPDSYIDFGLYGMMGVLFALGLLYGVVYNYLLKKSSANIIFNYSAACAFFLEFNALEMDSTFLLGRLFASMITFYILIKLAFPKLVKYLKKSNKIINEESPFFST